MMRMPVMRMPVMGIESMSVMGMPVIVVFELLEVVKLVVEVCWLKVLERWTLVSLQALFFFRVGDGSGIVGIEDVFLPRAIELRRLVCDCVRLPCSFPRFQISPACWCVLGSEIWRPHQPPCVL